MIGGITTAVAVGGGVEAEVEVIGMVGGMGVRGEGTEGVRGGAGVRPGKGVRSVEPGSSNGIERGRRRGSDSVRIVVFVYTLPFRIAYFLFVLLCFGSSTS